MTLNELFARFDKLAAVRVLGLGGGADCGESLASLVAAWGCGGRVWLSSRKGESRESQA